MSFETKISLGRFFKKERMSMIVKGIEPPRTFTESIVLNYDIDVLQNRFSEYGYVEFKEYTHYFDKIRLDGGFSLEELEDIVDAMKVVKNKLNNKKD